MKPEHKVILALTALILCSCGVLGGASSATPTTTTITKSMDEMGNVIEERTTVQPYVSPAEQQHAEATKRLFEE
jgi:hypothetical protein